MCSVWGLPHSLAVISMALAILPSLLKHILYAEPLIEEEMTFQVALLERVSQPRDAANILDIKSMASQDGVSNLGISLE